MNKSDFIECCPTNVKRPKTIKNVTEKTNEASSQTTFQSEIV